MAASDMLRTDAYNDIEENSLTAWKGSFQPPSVNSNMLGGGAIRLEIFEQPHPRKLRFRYKSEGETAGSIVGESSTAERPTYPSVQIINCTGPAELVVSTVSKEDPPCPHPYSLVGKDCHDGVCIIKVGPGQTLVSCSGMGVRCERKKEIKEAFELKLKNPRQAFREETSRRPDDLDVNCLRLCFQLYQEHPDYPGSMAVVSQPVLSNPVYDKKAAGMCNLQIVRIDKTSGKVSGGDEIYMFVEKVKKEDIEVRFMEEQWEARADFGQSDVHKQYAIVFKTPAYRKLDITNSITVQIKLFRPSDSEYSDPVKFIYKPAESDDEGIQRKRQKVANFSKFLTGNQPFSRNKQLPKPELIPRPGYDVRELLRRKVGENSGGMFAVRPSGPVYQQQNAMQRHPQMMPPRGAMPGRQALKRPYGTDRVHEPPAHTATTLMPGIRQVPPSTAGQHGFAAGNPPVIRHHRKEVPIPQAAPALPTLTKPPGDFPFTSVLDFQAESYQAPGVAQAMNEILERQGRHPQMRSPRRAAEAQSFSPISDDSFSFTHQRSPKIESSATEDKFFDQIFPGLSPTSETDFGKLSADAVSEFFAASEFEANSSSTPKPDFRQRMNPAQRALGALGSDVVCDGSPVIDMKEPFASVSVGDAADELNAIAPDLPEGGNGTVYGINPPFKIPNTHNDQTVPNSNPCQQMETEVMEAEQVVPQTEFYPTVSAVIDHNGGKLEMPEFGVCLVVPQNAIPSGQPQKIFLSVSWCKVDKPPLENGESWVSPVVCCEPTGLKFQTPVALSFQHCLNFKDKHRGFINLHCSNTEIGTENNWQKKSILDQGDCSCIVDETRCIVITDHFTKYGMSATMTEDMSKRIKVAVFAAPMSHSHSNAVLRVYAINGTPDAYQEMINEEKQMNGTLAEATKYYPFFDNNMDLDVILTHIDDGWALINCPTQIALPRKDILEGFKTSCTFRFADQGKGALNFGTNIHVHQQNNTNSPICFVVSQSLEPPKPVHVPVGASYPASYVDPWSQRPPPRAVERPMLALPPPSFDGSVQSFPSTNNAFFQRSPSAESTIRQLQQHPPLAVDRLRKVIPFHIKCQLGLRLNPLRDPIGNDWRMLADEMKLSALIENFKMKSSPTDELLLIWESNHDASKELGELIQILRKIGRPDAAQILEEYLQQQGQGFQQNSSGSHMTGISAPNAQQHATVKVETEDNAPDLLQLQAGDAPVPDIRQNTPNMLPNPSSVPNNVTMPNSHVPGVDGQGDCFDSLEFLNAKCDAIQNEQLRDATLNTLQMNRSQSDEANENFQSEMLH
ncbi:uncharacterized protein [Ptychodera flava]|uniref:uncharacterized protein n=1 Tax=Ptychodera flava TaxID=63121 RepID=UPI00396A6B97